MIQHQNACVPVDLAERLAEIVVYHLLEAATLRAALLVVTSIYIFLYVLKLMLEIHNVLFALLIPIRCDCQTRIAEPEKQKYGKHCHR